MGMVYRARHLQLGKPFALKIISPAFADDSAARARFNEEAKLASEISHPNIVSVVDFGEDDRIGAYMVMELVEGEPLVTPGAPPMSVRRACDVLGQVADALDHVHRKGIVHGDVKADNIMLAADKSNARRRQVVRLLDFGLARRPDGRTEEHISGSPHYIAPERAMGGAVSVSADVYAIGVLGYLLLTGSVPFDGNPVQVMMQHISDPIVSPSERRGEVLDAALEALILRALEKDPAQRHASAAAFRYELNAVMEMLELTRRRRSGVIPRVDLPGGEPGSREASVQAAFDASHIPQAHVRATGEISAANHAFCRLVDAPGGLEGTQLAHTSLATVAPTLMAVIAKVYAEGRTSEVHATVYRSADEPVMTMTIWLAPLAIDGSDVQLFVRIDEIR
jgi:serine/threonine-protein kinase